MLRAAAGPGGDFTLEANGSVDGLTSAGQHPSQFNPMNGTTAPFVINWGYGPGVGPGPCAMTIVGCHVGDPGGYFYNPRPLATPNHNFQIPHPYGGGLIQIPGFADVVATSIHIRDGQENGLLWRDNNDGETKAALQNYITPTPSAANVHAFSGFAKSNGLGDIAAYTQDPPVQIGNRLWYDRDHNGIQDAGEAGVSGVTVFLLDDLGNVLGTATTDSNGFYQFTGLAAGSYRLRFVAPTDATFTAQDQGNDDTKDSDVDSAGFTATFTLSEGQSRDDLDAGLFFDGITKEPPPG